MAGKSDIHLCQTTDIDLSKNTQKEEWFLKINPNGRIPALTDKHTDGSTIRVFESGAILQYLVDKYDTEHKVSYPFGTKEYYETNSWVKDSKLSDIAGYAPEKIPYGIARYQNETRRLYRVLDTALAASEHGFLVGDRVTIADISSWGWVASAKWSGVDIDEFPALKKWVEKLLERPGFEKGRHVPKPHKAFELAKASEEEIEKTAAASRAWVQASMKDDAKK
ncbi:Glutathione S-transferase 2 [Cytospora paraplurivora]|uniref:Glutathione S-transferase 2 n=1 Tax=Cytospora paraplurivora TaxID=2898453 RepID=A0AAN9UM55_9PEZI